MVETRALKYAGFRGLAPRVTDMESCNTFKKRHFSDQLGEEESKTRLKKAQEEAEEVKVIMMDNMNKAEERTEKLTDLESRADKLLKTSKVFEKTAHTVMTRQRWKNKKMIVVGIVAGVLVLIVLIVLIVYLSP